MTAEGDDAVLHFDADGVKDVSIAYAVIGELFRQLGLQFVVGNGGAGDLDVIADGGDALGLVNALVCVGLYS